MCNKIHSLNFLFTCRTDTTKAGYALGSPKQREVVPSPERSLSPAACAIIRAIMHSALIWASSNNEVIMSTKDYACSFLRK